MTRTSIVVGQGLTLAGAFGIVSLVAAIHVGIAAQGGRRPLIDAVKMGDTAALRTLLDQQIDVNAAEVDGTTALHWAVQRNDTEAADLLLGAGANVQAENRYGVKPLALASLTGSGAVVEMLLNAGADPNSASPEGETPLMLAARTGTIDVVRALLASGAEVDATEGWRGQTALMWAAARDNEAATEALIETGATVHARSRGGFTPLLFAVREGNINTLHVLLAGGADPDDALPDVEDTYGGLEGASALIVATINAHYDVAEVLLQAGADPNAAAQGWTALHQVVWTRRPNLGRNPPFPVPSGRLDGVDMARLLVEHGADPNARQVKEPRDGNRNMLNRVGSTPLLQAAKVADVEMMRLLVALGADPMLTTEEGATPLMAVAGVGIWKIGENPGTNEEAQEAVRLVWELGNDVNAVDANGDTALHGAIHRGAGEIVEFLVEKGANIDAVNKRGWSPLSIAQGVFYPNTFNRHSDLVLLLQELGADPDVGTRRPVDLAPWERLEAGTPGPPQ